jgi:uncharacterized membrane protein YjgN (DUF898 family)
MDTVTTGEPQAGTPAAPIPVEFTGKRGYLFRLALKNAFLTLLTLGIYRFWAKTRIRRYFWSNARIGDEAFEYTGLPSELLIGFLIAVAVLLPLTLIYTGITFYWNTDPVISGTVEAAYYVILVLLFQFAFYRMWRYRLSRTTWRGIRFGLDGSALEYTLRAGAWLVLTLVTLGFAYPWMSVALKQYLWRHVRFGNSVFTIQASGLRLLKYWLVMPLSSLVLMGLAFAFSDLSFDELAKLVDRDAASQLFEDKATSILLFVGAAYAIGFVAILLFIWYRVRELRYVASCIQFDGTGFASDLRARRIYGLIAATLGFLILAMIPIGFIGFFLTFVFAPLALAVPVILTLTVLPPVIMVVFRYGLFAHTCATLTITDLASFDRVAQNSDRGPQRGEGLADALDVGAF